MSTQIDPGLSQENSIHNRRWVILPFGLILPNGPSGYCGRHDTEGATLFSSRMTHGMKDALF